MSMSDLSNLLQIAKERGAPYVAKILIDVCQEDALPMRRKSALFVANLLGHRFSTTDISEAGDHFVGCCRNCQMTIKIGKDRGLSGNLVSRECPARRKHDGTQEVPH